jgi:ABC-type branched-subunit amino acid transport system substrate-binding protein
VTMPRHRVWRLVALGIALMGVWLAACATTPATTIYTIATIFPTVGPDAAIGNALQNAVDLAVKQNQRLGSNVTLRVLHIQEGAVTGAPVADAAADPSLVAIVGPLASAAAPGILPVVGEQGIVTVSPGASLPGLTQADAAQAEGLSFTALHPAGKPIAFFRLSPTDTAAGKFAADLAVAPGSAHGLHAHAVFVVTDGTASGAARAAAFGQELKAKHGALVGQRVITPSDPLSVQAAVSAIVDADPDLVFYAGGIQGGAALRAALSLSGAPGLPLLATGDMGDDPDWATLVGQAPAAGNTTALVPARDLSALPAANSFVAAYKAAYPGQALVPQSALAYDAAMDEIAALKGLLKAGKPVTRASLLAAVAGATYTGVTGTITFDKNGDSTAHAAFAVYTCDAKGMWHYQTQLGG